MAQGGVWTDEWIEQLRKLWDDGLSAAQIAQRIPVSRNAILGKAHRLGLSLRPSPIQAPWPAHEARLLAELWDSDLSNGALARRVGHSWHACRQYARRHFGLEGRSFVPSPSGARRATVVPAMPVKVAAPVPAATSVLPALLPVAPVPAVLSTGAATKDGRWRPLAEAGRNECRWPEGDLLDGSLRFCCAPVPAAGQSYCAEHEERSRGRAVTSLERFDPDARRAA